MSYFYGPVPSRRLGFSLGVDLIPKKYCSFDCLYCQLGRTTHKTIKRFSYINLNKFKRELKEIIRKKPKIDYITLSGSGEPTLHKNLDKIILAIRNITKGKFPICVITNSSLLYRKDVRRELKGVDLIIPSLDAATSKIFYKINRPYKGVIFKKIVNSLIKLRKEFKGKIWLEVMLIKGLNDSLKEARKFKKIIEKIKPDKIQLNLPIRPAVVKIHLPDPKRLRQIKKIINKNIESVAPFIPRKQDKYYKSAEKEIYNFLKRRPATLDDLESSLGANAIILLKHLKDLLDQKKIKKYTHHKKRYFVGCD